jgi:hypothetical protein
MKSWATTDFWQEYAKLSPEMKTQARKAFRLWQQNMLHPSLHFKKVGKTLWAARISGGYTQRDSELDFSETPRNVCQQCFWLVLKSRVPNRAEYIVP